MNFAQQLIAASSGTKHVTMSEDKKRSWQRATELAHAQHTANAVDRYRVVMQGKDWLTTYNVECLLGYGRTVARGFLFKLVELGFVERRNRGGAKTFNRRHGYEYKWKEEL